MTNAQRVVESGVVAVVRLGDLRLAVELTRALVAGGISSVEFTFTNRRAGEAISCVRESIGEAACIGAGTVLDPETARIAILAGAEYIVTPAYRPQTIEMCRRYSTPSIIGAFTPTEILSAWEAGADFIKVHPAGLGGPKYFKDVLGPYPNVKLIPSGGVTMDNAGDFIRAGAVAVAMGSALVDPKTVASQDWQTLTDRAVRLCASIAEARNRSS